LAGFLVSRKKAFLWLQKIGGFFCKSMRHNEEGEGEE